MRRARALLRAAVLLRTVFTYDAEIAAQMDVEEEGSEEGDGFPEGHACVVA